MKKDKLIIRPINENLRNSAEENYILEIDDEKHLIKLNESQDIERKINKNTFAWTQDANNFFISRRPNTESIPAGVYDINISEMEGIFLTRKSVIVDELFTLPEPNQEIVINDFVKFLSLKERYNEYGITYKRGVLLHGVPGTGKSTLVNLLSQDIVANYNGIVLVMNNLSSFIPMVHNIRALEPDRPILAIIEDLYEFLCNNSRDRFLNLLDGNMQVDGIFYLATTNFVRDLPASITNRPSRFDRLVEIGFPTAEARRIYIIKKLKPHDAERIGAEMIEKMVKDTEGMSFSHLKELITAFVIMESDYDDTIKRLQTMNTATYEY